MKIASFIAALTAASAVTAIALPPPPRNLNLQEFDSMGDLKQLRYAQHREYNEELKQFKQAQKEKHQKEMQQAFEMKKANDIKKHEELKQAYEMRKAQEMKQAYEMRKAHQLNREQELDQSSESESKPFNKVGAQLGRLLQSGPDGDQPEMQVNVTVTIDTPESDASENQPTKLAQDAKPSQSTIPTWWNAPGRIGRVGRVGPRRQVSGSNDQEHEHHKLVEGEDEDKDKRCISCGIKYLDEHVHGPPN